MLAARLRDGAHELRLEEVAVPSPKPGECLVRIHACGICGSDLHVLEGMTPVPRPVTLGHECAGTVVEVGAGDADGLLGRGVVVNPILACLQCTPCRRGRPQICERRSVLGFHRDGAFAEYACVPLTNVVGLPPGLSLTHAALVEPMATPFHGLTARARVRPGDAVAVIGVGGLGIHGVQIARMLGAGAVIAVDVDAVALRRAEALGATHTVDPSHGDVVARVVELSAGGVDVALECVGRASTITQAVAMLRPGGCAAVIGIGDEAPSLPPASSFARTEVDVKGVYAYSQPEMGAVAGLLAAGALDAAAAISATYRLSEIDAAVEHARSGRGSPVRVLVRPAGSTPSQATS